jgi:hypothetical protein
MRSRATSEPKWRFTLTNRVYTSTFDLQDFKISNDLYFTGRVTADWEQEYDGYINILDFYVEEGDFMVVATNSRMAQLSSVIKSNCPDMLFDNRSE